MNDDFIAEHVLPSISLHYHSVNLSSDQPIESNNLNLNVQHSSPSIIETGSETTLNATCEHIELTSRFFNNIQFSDVRLRIGTNVYYAHKFILAKSSDVLATLLYSQHWTSNDSEIVLEEQDECQGDVFEK
ncbi:unnamed protein product [Rotaria socialis]